MQSPIGKLMAPKFISENELKQEQRQLTGMNEITDTCQSDHTGVQKVTATANLSHSPCGTSDQKRFAGRTLTSGNLVLLSWKPGLGSCPADSQQ